MNFNDARYKNERPYPWSNDLTPEESRQMRQAYKVREAEIRETVRADLEKEHGITRDHPKADLLWRMAWEHGHSAGYSEVAHYYEDFVQLVRE